MESLGGLVSRTPLEHSGRLNLTCNCESQKSQARVSLLAKFNVSSDSTLAKASERRVRGWGPPAQFHVEHQERRTSGLIWWGRLGGNSRFEPTKSMRTETTPIVHKTSADRRNDMMGPVGLDCNRRWGYFSIISF